MINISDAVIKFTSPFYNWFRQNGLLIVLFVVIYIEVRVSKKIMQGTKAKKWSKCDYGNTNEWFSLDTSDKAQNKESVLQKAKKQS